MPHVFSGDPQNLESNERKNILPVAQILADIGMDNISAVVDFGAGSGYFTEALLQTAEKSTQVIAIDSSEKMVELLKERFKDYPNFRVWQSTNLNDLEEKVDLILTVTVLHELEDPELFLNQAWAKLRAGGKLVAVDWQKQDTPYGPPIEHRLAKETVQQMIAQQPLEKALNQNFYFLIWQK